MFKIHNMKDMPMLLGLVPELFKECATVCKVDTKEMFKSIAAEETKVGTYSVDGVIETVSLMQAKIEFIEQAPVFYIAAIAGNLAPHVDDHYFAYQQVKEMWDCQGMQIKGRPGFTKMLRSVGFKPVSVTMEVFEEDEERKPVFDIAGLLSSPAMKDLTKGSRPV